MRKKILYCATVDYHFKAFHLPYMRWFQEQGWEVHVAAKGDTELPYCDKKFIISIQRSPFNLQNLKAFKELKEIIKENEYDIIHVHTPMAGVLIRLAARKARKGGTKVLYTAHGFHFCKGAPIANWIVYYPLEKWLSRYTDYLITINGEDFNLVKKHHFKAQYIKRVHGVGVDTQRYKPISWDEEMTLRERYEYDKDNLILFYAAELNKNKNQGFLLKVIAELRDKIPNMKLLLIGKGPLMDYYKSLARNLMVNDIVDFLGFREDVDILAQISDIGVGSSLREGLPVNIMEAMACGKPVVVTSNRGHKELVDDGYNGFIIEKSNVSEFANRIYELYKSQILKDKLSKNAIKKLEAYSLHKVMLEMTEIYGEVMESDKNAVAYKSATGSS